MLHQPHFLFDVYHNCGGTNTGCGNCKFGFARSGCRTQNSGGCATEQLHLRTVKTQQAGGITVGGGKEFGCATDFELDHAVVVGHNVAILIGNVHGYVHKIVSIGHNLLAVCRQYYMVGFPGGTHCPFLHRLSGIIHGHHLHFARLIHHIVPDEAVAVHGKRIVAVLNVLHTVTFPIGSLCNFGVIKHAGINFFPYAHRFAVDKQLGLRI